jgi:hypothetical protein
MVLVVVLNMIYIWFSFVFRSELKFESSPPEELRRRASCVSKVIDVNVYSYNSLNFLLSLLYIYIYIKGTEIIDFNNTRCFFISHTISSIAAL